MKQKYKYGTVIRVIAAILGIYLISICFVNLIYFLYFFIIDSGFLIEDLKENGLDIRTSTGFVSFEKAKDVIIDFFNLLVDTKNFPSIKKSFLTAFFSGIGFKICFKTFVQRAPYEPEPNVNIEKKEIEEEHLGWKS